jgi:hypothetical protein
MKFTEVNEMTKKMMNSTITRGLSGAGLPDTDTEKRIKQLQVIYIDVIDLI